MSKTPEPPRGPEELEEVQSKTPEEVSKEVEEEVLELLEEVSKTPPLCRRWQGARAPKKQSRSLLAG